MVKNYFTLLLCLVAGMLSAQLTNNGATIVIEDGATLVVEGDVLNTGSGIITNSGTLDVKGNLNTASGTLTSTTLNAKIIFSGTMLQTFTLGSDISVKDIDMTNTAGNVSLAGANLTVTGILNFLAGTGNIDINDQNLSIASGGSLTRADGTAGFVQTDGDGLLIKEGHTGSYEFQVGFSDTEFNPVSVDNTGAADDIGVRSLENAFTVGDDESSAALTGDVVNASWEVTGGGAGDLDVTVNWVAADEEAMFDNTKSGVSMWDATESKWDLDLTGLGANATDATKTGGSAGYYAVGGTSVMDFAMLTPQIVLSGPYNNTTSGDLMNTNLTALLPGAEPYAAMTSFTHSGLGGGETAGSFTDIVDWVFVEIRDAADNTNVLGTFSALLNKNGDVVGTDLGALKMVGLKSGASSPGYNIVVRHRNHLGVMTASAVGAGTLSRTTGTMVNFKAGGAFGTDGMKNNGNGVFSLWAGDANGDGKVRYVNNGFPFIIGDGTTILTELSNNPFGQLNSAYNNSDINLDGIVRYVNNGFPFIIGDGTTVLTELSNNPFGQIDQQF